MNKIYTGSREWTYETGILYESFMEGFSTTLSVTDLFLLILSYDVTKQSIVDSSMCIVTVVLTYIRKLEVLLSQDWLHFEFVGKVYTILV